jgi:hypothetical protein
MSFAPSTSCMPVSMNWPLETCMLVVQGDDSHSRGMQNAEEECLVRPGNTAPPSRVSSPFKAESVRTMSRASSRKSGSSSRMHQDESNSSRLTCTIFPYFSSIPYMSSGFLSRFCPPLSFFLVPNLNCCFCRPLCRSASAPSRSHMLMVFSFGAFLVISKCLWYYGVFSFREFLFSSRSHLTPSPTSMLSFFRRVCNFGGRGRGRVDNYHRRGYGTKERDM